MSRDSLYVASYNSAWSCGALSSCRGGQWWCPPSASPCTFSSSTVIVGFGISGSDGRIERRATARVPGYLLSQWSMDQHAGR